MLLSRIDKPGWIFLGVLALACIVVPALNLLTAPARPSTCRPTPSR